MSYTRRAGNFGKTNAPLSSVGQRRPGGGNVFHNAQNKQHQQPLNQHQQNLQAQQQQFQSQLQQQEKARAAQQQALQNQQNKQQMQKPPQQQPMAKQQPPASSMQQAGVQRPAQQQQKVSPQQPSPQPQSVQQQPAQQQPAPQQPAPQQTPQTTLLQAAEQLLAEQNLTGDKPMANTNSDENLDYAEEPMVTESTTENAVQQHKPRPFWMKRNGRINRAERAKRRNVRLRKLLQPKNALMIINELVGHVTFDLAETKPGESFNEMYKASVAIEGKDHIGFGKSKALAKTAAAETAVRSMILNKLRIIAQIPPSPAPGPTETSPPVVEDENRDLKMEITEDNQEDVSWTHIASFAIHKLFSSWGDDGNVADMISRASSVGSLIESKDSSKEAITPIHTQPEQKPAKKLPENASLMNPIMLLNQMHPSAKYEELGKTGTPPHIQFTIKCTVDNQSFVGTGPNKKAARKQATFEACKTLLGIEYPLEVLQATSTPVKPAPMEVA